MNILQKEIETFEKLQYDPRLLWRCVAPLPEYA